MTEQLDVRRDGNLGRITLNRPNAINALTLDMIRGITHTLRAWWEDPAVEVLLLDGAGDRGLCAGGDITVVCESAMGDHEIAATLWREEYMMDQLIARFPKPVVAIMDGVVMGGGLGLAGRADVRVVTERSRVAMPEVLIGFTPDCGTSDLLAGAPGELGTHVALTSIHLGAADAMLCGLADTYLPSSELARVPDLVRLGSLRSLGTPPRGSLADARPWIDECYSGDDPAKIVSRLAEHREPDARAAGELVGHRSPTAVAVTVHALRLALDEPGLEPCLVRDFRAIRRFLAHPDLVEGITARVVDRTHEPRWCPPLLSDVAPSEVLAFFAPLDDDLELLPS